MSSPDKPVLKVAPCDHAAAKYAVENWHYSGKLPSTLQKVFKIGAWENDVFVGCVVFGHGANPSIGKPYGLTTFEVCELTRIALKKGHTAPVSRIVRIAMKLLKQQNQRLQLIVSYADTGQGHHGGVYQAGGWIYEGISKGVPSLMYNGRKWHAKALVTSHPNYDRKKAIKVDATDKHKYLMPLDEAMKRKVEPLRKPYPKRAGSSSVEHSDSIGEVGGSIPTPALNSSKSCVSEN